MKMVILYWGKRFPLKSFGQKIIKESCPVLTRTNICIVWDRNAMAEKKQDKEKTKHVNTH
jgi:hypothetical protein